MKDKAPRRGEAVALARNLSVARDPLGLYAALSDNGARTDTMLFEQAEGATLLLEQAAVRAECRGREVALIALTANGRSVLAHVAAHLPARVAFNEADRLVLRFPAPRGVDAEERLAEPSPFHALRALTIGLKQKGAEEPFGILCLGAIAYDHVDLFEQLPPAAEDPLQFPDFIFWLAESFILFMPGARPRAISTAFGSDEPAEAKRNYFAAAERLAELVGRCERAGGAPVDAPAPGNPDFSAVDLDDAAYEALVVRMKAEIAAGEVYQIVPSRAFRAPCPDPLRAYAGVRELERSPYGFFVSSPDHLLFGASPETSVRVFRQEGYKVEVKPIAGTRPRGASGDEDDRLEAEMRLDAKELAEHMMLVDLARNDVARISIAGTRRVDELMHVERYARVMHLVSRVTGSLRTGYDPFDALQACLNVGTLTGAPKIRATELLRQVERDKRGPYGGAVGWIDGEGCMESAVVIRSAIVREGTAFVRAGAGIVHDSDPRAEAEETRRKAAALLSVLAGATA